MNKTKILFFLVLLCTPIVLAQDEINIIEIEIAHNTELQEFSINTLKVYPGYISLPDLPGNAKLSLITSDGSELHSVRIGFITEGILISPPPYEPDLNFPESTEWEEEPEEIPEQIFKLVMVPYFENAEKIQILMDAEDSAREFEIANRLCNNNQECEEEESALSCSDCQANQEDGVCVWAADEVCDPDCLLGVDPDCLDEIDDPTIEPTQKIILPITSLPGEIAQEPGDEGLGLLPLIGVAGIVLVALIVFYFRKATRGE